MYNRLTKGFVVLCMCSIFGCGGWVQKTKTIIQRPFKGKEAVPDAVEKEPAGDHLELGKKYFQKGDLRGAAEEFESAVTQRPDSPDVHYNLGLVYYEMGDNAKAITEYKKAIRFKPDFADAYFNIAVAYDRDNKPEEALQNYKKAMELGIDDAALHYNTGLSLIKLSRFDEAKNEYQKALEQKPDLPEAYNNLGYLAEASSDFDGAIVMYKRALSIDPGYTMARENLERLTKGPAAPVKGKGIFEGGVLRRLSLELDGKWAFDRDLEFERTGKKGKAGSDYKRGLFRVGYGITDRIDVFLTLGATDLAFDDAQVIDRVLETNSIFRRLFGKFDKVLGFAYGAGVNGELYQWQRMKLGFDAGIDVLMGSNEDDLKSGTTTFTSTADWMEYELSLRTRYLGFDRIVPYGGLTFSKVDGNFEVKDNAGHKTEADYNESDPFGILVGGNYYFGSNIRLQAEAKFLAETSLAMRLRYNF